MSFDALPNEMLHIILNQSDIPLQERIMFRAISPRCLTVIEDGFKKETKLDIIEFSITRKKYEPNSLYLSDAKYLTADLFQLLGRLFTAVSELGLYMDSDEFFGQLPGLLPQFSATLKTLTVKEFLRCYSDNHQFPLEVLTQLAIGINSLTNLTCLTLSTDSLHVFFFIKLSPTLARLERFILEDSVIYDYGPTANRQYDMAIFASLTDRCTYLKLNADNFYWHHPCIVDGSLTDLQLSFVDEECITQIGERLPSLRTLAIQFQIDDEVHLTAAKFRDLSALTQLVDLRFAYFCHHPEHIFGLPSATDQPLSTVKRLHLKMFINPEEWQDWEDSAEEDINKYIVKCIKKDKLNFKHLGKVLTAWFPALEQLTVANTFDEYIGPECSLEDTMKQNLKVFLSSVEVKIVSEY